MTFARMGEVSPETKLEEINPADRTINRRKNGEALDLMESALRIAGRGRFLHWQAAFPGVWDNWESAKPTGEFDAIIGNPPWDRIKL